jgi:hypothetical protein
MNTPNLDKRLKHHDQMCWVHIHSLGDDRKCTCGKDSALIEKEVLVDALEMLVKIDEFLRDSAIGRIESNSAAHFETQEIIERAKHERIIGTKPSVRQTRK